jgi:hypothetical protein
MFVSIIIFSAFLSWIIHCAVLCFRAKTRGRGFLCVGITMGMIALLRWLAAPGKMTAEPPSMEEIVGTWECRDVSPEFLRTAGLNSRDFSSKLIFRSDSSVTVERMPDETDTVSFSRSWELAPPELTPAGAWTITIEAWPRSGPYRFVCNKKFGRMTLVKNIGGSMGYSAHYQRISK